MAVVLLLLVNLATTPGFFSVTLREGRLYGSLIDILNMAAPTMLLAIGMTLVIATGGIDLSVGAVMAVAGSVMALMAKNGAPIPLILAAVAAICIVLGVLNGTLVAAFGIQPMVATLVLMVSGRGIAQLLTNGQIVTISNPGVEFIGNGFLFGLPFAVSLVAAILAITALFVRRTALGLFIESIGDNEQASRFSGVNVRLVKVLAYAFCAVCAGAAGLIQASWIKAADANNAGMYLELDAILAAILGGTPLTGGRFSFVGAILGVLIIQTLTTTILTKGVPPEFNLVVKAIAVLLVCLLQSPEARAKLLPRRQAA